MKKRFINVNTYCNSFSGGPIYCQNEESKEWSLVGISPTDSRPKCGIEKYRISAIAGSTEWILQTINALNDRSNTT